MKRILALVVIALIVVAAAVTATVLLTLHPSSAGLVADAPVDTITCDSVGSIVLQAQRTLGDPEVEIWCESMAVVPGIVGYSLAALALLGAFAWVLVLRRTRVRRVRA